MCEGGSQADRSVHITSMHIHAGHQPLLQVSKEYVINHSEVVTTSYDWYSDQGKPGICKPGTPAVMDTGTVLYCTATHVLYNCTKLFYRYQHPKSTISDLAIRAPGNSGAM